jgi:hypothetical protein
MTCINDARPGTFARCRLKCRQVEVGLVGGANAPQFTKLDISFPHTKSRDVYPGPQLAPPSPARDAALERLMPINDKST